MKIFIHNCILSPILVLAAVVSTWAAPGVTALTTPVLPANASRTAINSLRVTSGTPTRYNITSLPGGGTLYLNGIAVTAARALTPTEATQLSFQPAGTAGNYSFAFTATDASGTSAAATYAISVGRAMCGQAVGFDFSTRPAAEDWRAKTNVPAGAVTIATSDYRATAGTVTLQTNNQGGTLGSALEWNASYASNSAMESQVTFTFSRALSSFTIVVQSIDASANSGIRAYNDQVQFDGYASNATTPIALTAANVVVGSTNSFSGGPNCVTGTITNTTGTPAGNVIVTFPEPITKLTLTYRNTTTRTNNQIVSIPSFGWCAEADIATTLTGPTRAQAGSQVAYTVTTTNNGPDVPATVTPTLQLPTGLTGLAPGNAGTYNTSTGLVTFPAISSLANEAMVTNTFALTMPATNAVSATATYTSTAADNVPTNNTATRATVQNRAPVANNVTNSPAILSSTTGQTTIASFNASDPDASAGNSTITSFTILSLPTTDQGTLYVDGTAATLNQVVTVPTSATTSNPGYQLLFVPNGAFDGNATFTYRATDDVGISSNTATYSVPVTAGADLVSTVGGQPIGVEGQSKAFSVTTTNKGPAASTNVVPTLRLSSKPSFSNVTVTNGSYDPTTGVVTFSATPSLASGASVVNAITLVVPISPASFTVTAANTSATADPSPANNNGTAAAAILPVAVSSIGPAGTTSACATPGRDGSPTITATPNTYYPATNQLVPQAATSLSVGTAVGTTPIAAGDLLLIMQMQGADIDYSNTDAYGDGVAGGPASGSIINGNFRAGQYEYAVAAAAVPLGGGTLTTTTGLRNSYENAAATATTGQRRFQVVRIPQYQNLTISGTVVPSPWNGSTGGILVLDVTGQLSFAPGARLDASGMGFRGGAGQLLTGTTSLASTDYRAAAPATGTTTTGAHAMKGEGKTGTPRYVNTGSALLDTGTEGYPSGSAGRGAPGNAGGGGNDADPATNSQNSGGGGGGNGARGGRGGNAWSSGAAVGGELGSSFSVPSTSRLQMGSGGGAGTTNDGTGGGPYPGYASSGAAGGGIVLVRTGSVRGAGTVLANGASASNAVLNDGSGGGGAGGAIIVTANNTASLSSLTLAANGGNGGTNTGGGYGAYGPGGGGGGGIILTNAAPSSASVASGANGTTAGGVAYGATAGAPGIVNSQISNRIGGSTAGINCSTDVVATISAPSSASNGQTVTVSLVFANNGSVEATTVTRTVTLASGDPAHPVANVVASGSTNISAPDPATGDVTIIYPSLSPLAAGASEALGISYVAPSAASVVATATITTASAEPVTDNNTSTARTTISDYAEVLTVMSGLSSSTTGRPTATYTVVYANNGPAAAANVTRTVTLPAGATLSTAQLQAITDQGGTYNSGTQVIDFGTLPTLNLRAISVFKFSYTAPNVGGSTNVVSNITTTTAQGANGGPGFVPDKAPFPVANNATSDLATDNVTVSAATVVPGQPASFTLNFINHGPADAASALRYAQLTPGLSGVSVTDNGVYDPATGIITYPSLALVNGAAAPSVVTFTAPATGPVNISGSLSGGGGSASSGIFANNQATGSIAVIPVADVATTLSGPPTVVAGNLATYAVTTANNGPSAAAEVVQTVQLPPNLTGVFPSGNGTYDATTGLVTFPVLALLSPGTFFNNTVSFLMPSMAFTASAAVATTTAEAPGTTANNTTTASPTTPVAPTTAQANVYNTLPYPAAIKSPGAEVVLTLVTGNHGPSPASDVVQQLALRPGLSISSISNGGIYNPITGVVTFPSIARQASGDSVTHTVMLAAPSTGPLVAVASVTSATSDPVPADNVVVLPVDIVDGTDVVTTLVGPGVAASTQVPTFTVTTRNRGLVAATNVVQTVSIPAGFALADVMATGGGVYDPATGVITWPAVASLAPEEVKTYTYGYRAPALSSTDASNPRAIVSRATVTSSTFDNVGTNNSVAVATDIKWNADVSIGVAGPTSGIVGNTVTFTISTINNGPAPATNVTTVLRTATNLQGVVISGGGVYDAASGLVTFPTIASQAVGATGAVTNTFTLLLPELPLFGIGAAANNTANDINLTNDAADITIPVSPRTSTLVDLQTTITANRTSQQAGQSIILTVQAVNNSTTVSTTRQGVTLPAGLGNVVVTGADGSPLAGAYNAASGVVTFPVINSHGAGTTLTYTVTVNDPGNDPLVATASVNGSFSDPTPANNTQTLSVTIVPVADVVTRLSGPTTMLPSTLATYQVVTVNNGPSPANAVRQQVQVPTGLSDVAISGGGSYDPYSGLVTFPPITTQAVGQFGAVTNTISFTFPTTASTVVGFVSSGTNEDAGNTASNTASLPTTLTNQLPLANTVTNRLQSPQGNTAEPLVISALSGYDPDGSLASFIITAVPAPNAGVLLLNGAPVMVNQVINPGEQAELRFDPVTGFVGNTFFRYTATDNQGATSIPALYTIAVGQDNAAVYTSTPVKGGTSNPYQDGDIIANVFDSNGGVYDATAEVIDNGIRTSSVSSGSLPNGMLLDPTNGQVRVADRTLLVAGDYAVGITTTDVNGGVTTQLVPLRIGARPLPVALLAFEAKTVGQDSHLKWATAQEQDNAGFRVERSVDGIRFETLTFLPGAGNSTQVKTYSFVDVGVGMGVKKPNVVYYRLQQIDRSGNNTYSPVRTVRFAPLNAQQALRVSLYPNPVETKTTLDLSTLPRGTYQVTIVDMTGRLLQTTTLAGGSSHPLLVDQLRPGTYLVIVQNNSSRFTQPLLKR